MSVVEYLAGLALMWSTVTVLPSQDGEELPADIHTEDSGCIMISLDIQGQDMNFSSASRKKKEKKKIIKHEAELEEMCLQVIGLA